MPLLEREIGIEGHAYHVISASVTRHSHNLAQCPHRIETLRLAVHRLDIQVKIFRVVSLHKIHGIILWYLLKRIDTLGHGRDHSERNREKAMLTANHIIHIRDRDITELT